MSRITLLGICLIFLVSCKKEGPIGPIGPVGPTGPAGAQGETGESGVNIISSDWINLQLESGVFAFVYYGKIEDERITQNIIDKGVVKLYADAFGTVHELPDYAFDGLWFTFSVGKIEVFSPTDWDTNSGYRYRFVLIPNE